MMQSATMAQRQQLRAIPVQIQANAILNMGLIELQQFIQAETAENPALSVVEGSRCPVCGFLTADKVCPVCGASMQSRMDSIPDNADERAYLEHAFASADPDAASFDPFRTVATTITLKDYLKQQARMGLSGRHLRIAEYLIELFDDDGYFRESLFDAADEFAAAVPEIESVLQVIQSLDPPGVGARDLRECLLIQIRSLDHDSDAACLAERILAEHWEDFSRMKLGAISKCLELPVYDIREACDFIRDNLTPRPSSAYRQPFEDSLPRETPAVAPDVIVRKKGGSFVPEAVDSHDVLLRVDETYDEVYQSIRKGEQMLSEEDSRHIKEHVERAKSVLDAIALRKKTLIRVALHIIDYQQGFLEHGPSQLRPLKQKEVAKALGVHESTICRALASKYCMLPSGEVVSFEVFFDAALPVRTLISRIIACSDKPISDGEIAKRLASEGVTIARRTVAKYREQMRVLPYQLRAA